MGQDAGENDCHQGHSSPFVRGPMRGVFGVQHKHRQEEKKGPVNTKFDAEDAPRRYGPASHDDPAALFLLPFYIVRQPLGAESCNITKSTVIMRATAPDKAAPCE